jgi:hypothetical protein
LRICGSRTSGFDGVMFWESEVWYLKAEVYVRTGLLDLPVTWYILMQELSRLCCLR